jgi:hypothetical protein
MRIRTNPGLTQFSKLACLKKRSISKAEIATRTELGRGMQWYVYLLTMATTVFFGRIAVGLLNRPIRAAFRLRRIAVERMLYFRKQSLPRSRELAISSREIHEYDHAVRNVREAQRTFSGLGMLLLAVSESEPIVRVVMALFGLNMVLAGRKLIKLSEVYATAKTDSDELRHAIEKAIRAASHALGISSRGSSDDLVKIRLEPMYLGDAGYPRKRNRSLGQQRTASRHVASSARLRRLRRAMPERIASTS